MVLQEQQRLTNEILSDIADARAAITVPYGHALEVQAAAIADLEETQRNAIVLPDGRRVYFTRDNSQLYGEDLCRITDAATITEARRPKDSDRTSYEDYYVHR